MPLLKSLAKHAFVDLWQTGYHNYADGSVRDTRTVEVVNIDGIDEYVPFHVHYGPQVIGWDGSASYMSAWPRMTSTEKTVYLRSVATKNRAYRESVGADDLVRHLITSMCFVPVWCPEHWPIEDAAGYASLQYLQEGLKGWRQPVPPISVKARVEPEKVLVFADAAGLCEQIISLAPQGVVGKLRYVRDPPETITPEAIKALLTEQKWDLVIFGCGLDPPPSGTGLEATIAHLDNVSKLYLSLMGQALRAFGSVQRFACLTRGMFTDRLQETEDEARGLGKVASGALFGMSNSLRMELGVPTHYVDLDWKPLKSAMKMIMSELFCQQTFGLNTVRIVGNKRYVLRSIPAAATLPQQDAIEYPAGLEAATPHDITAKTSFPKDGIVAVTGGSGSLAVVFAGMLVDKAIELGATYKIMMLSRSGAVKLPADIERFQEIMQKAASCGIQIEQVKLDVGEKQAVDDFVAANSPNITGVIHTAGVLQDAMLQAQTWEKFDQVLQPKTRGALYLHDAFERHSNPRLAIFWVFSSVSAYGNPGQINYAGANTALDALVRYRRAKGLTAHSLQWGAWGEAGMFMNMREEERQNAAWGLNPPFTNSEALGGLEEGLRTGLPVLTLWKYNLSLLLATVGSMESVTAMYIRNFLAEMSLAPMPSQSPLDTTYAWVKWHHLAFEANTGKRSRRMLSDGSC